MVPVCHRCGSDLPRESRSRFCPSCGAPQLLISSAVSEEAESGASSTGAAPPPRPHAIEWRGALEASLLVSGVMAVLLLAAARVPAFSLVWLLWTGAGALIALQIYKHRHGGARMNAAIGARIGATLGILMAAAFCLALAVAGVVTRFYLHGMGNFDRELHQRLAQQISAAVAANPAAGGLAQQQMLPAIIAGSLLLGLAMASLFLVLISVVGGALGGLLEERRSAVL